MKEQELFEDDSSPGQLKQEINIKKHLLRLVLQWPYILAFLILCLSIGYAYNYYVNPVYSVKARITTKKFSNSNNSIIPGLVDASFFLDGLTEVYEEIPILKSPSRIMAVLEKLDFRVTYFSKGLVKTIELSKGHGFDVKVDTIKGTSCPYSIPIFVNAVSENRFQLFSENETWNTVFKDKEFVFGELFWIGDARIKITNTNGKTSELNKYYFVLNRDQDLVAQFTRKLQINWAVKGSSMMDLYIASELPEKDIQFLRAFIKVVEEKGLSEKNETLTNTIKFIDAQMAMVADSLNYYQKLRDGLKLDNRTILTGSEQIYTKLNDLDQKKSEIVLSERYLDYITDYFKKNSDAEVFAPSLVGISMPPLEGWVTLFVNQKLQERSFVNEFNSQNPLVNRNDSSKNKLVKGIYEAIKSARQMNKRKMNEINQQESQFYASVGGAHKGARDLAKYERLFLLNSTLFDLFVKRKAEAAISRASATSDYRVIDDPEFSRAPFKPDKMVNLTLAAAIGLIFPIGFFLFMDITNNKIQDKDDLLGHTLIPLLGSIGHSTYESRLVVKDHPRSVVAESLRAVRANLKFITANVKTPCRTFIVTSSVGGEGKTFCSINLAYILAASHKKVVVLGADLRKPQLGNYVQASTDHGLSNYLAGYGTEEELILSNGKDEPHFIDSGKIPPNPAELLGNDRMAALHSYLKERYDYVIFDTPPIGLVSDAMELFKYSDYNILIVRQGVTPKAALTMVNDLYLDGKIKNFAVLLNDIELLKKRGSIYGAYQYGMGYSGYGFGYYEEDNGKSK
jgi:capsular exopolysaccharide synthesis family protein